MNLLSLTFPELKRLLFVYFCLTGLMAIAFFLIRWGCFDAAWWAAAWQGASSAMTLATIALGAFSRKTWTSPRWSQLLNRPMIHGVWYGHLDSSFLGIDGNRMAPIPIYLVIRQTYLTLSIESFTANQDGESNVEALLQNVRTQALRLSYIFELRRQYNGENKLTLGAGDLKLIDGGRRLRGHYWTNSPTQGTLDLQLKSRYCDGVNSFGDCETSALIHPIYVHGDRRAE